jgi:hypothetical protein
MVSMKSMSGLTDLASVIDRGADFVFSAAIACDVEVGDYTPPSVSAKRLVAPPR